jgi:hypothetical protein
LDCLNMLYSSVSTANIFRSLIFDSPSLSYCRYMNLADSR